MQEAGIVENLVTQFSSALDCFRELVQNSIDAGSPQVEIWMEFERGEGHQGVISIHVDDFGEGMDEQIIDNQLTKLFASTKENDLTKIGKFGIGFVSVFALRPQGVLVHTGRAGEYWEVFFHEDRSFSKTQLDMPVEGTQITIFLQGDYHRYRELVGGVRDTLRHWCSHSETEVSFEDRSPVDGGFGELEIINEEFEVPGECMTRVMHQGTEIVLSYTRKPLYGFYNRGLTLAYSEIGENVLFERTKRFGHIAFKIKSRYLEHTLSRETVMRDENYEKAMVLLDAAASQELLGGLVTRIEEVVGRERWGHEDVTEYTMLMGFLIREQLESLLALEERLIFRFVDGRPSNLRRLLEIWERDGRLLVADSRTKLTDELRAQKIPVVFGRAPGFWSSAPGAADMSHICRIFARYAHHHLSKTLVERTRGLVGWLFDGVMSGSQKLDVRLKESMNAPEQVYVPVILDAKPAPLEQALVDAAGELLVGAQTGFRRMALGELGSAPTSQPLFVVARKLSPLMALPPEGASSKKNLEVVVNRDHPQFRVLARLYERDPQMAAYCLAKDLLLDEDRMLERDIALMKLARGV